MALTSRAQDVLRLLRPKVTTLRRRVKLPPLHRPAKPMPLFSLPPGAVPQKTIVPAYWTLEPKFDDAWAKVRAAGSTVHAVVIEQSWPQWIKNNPSQRQQATDHLDSLPGLKLGYVSTRAGNPVGPLLSDSEILVGPKVTKRPDGSAPYDDSVKAWYDEFGGHIDGVYLDEAVLPDDTTSVASVLGLAAQFKATHPGDTLMVLAGTCVDEQVLSGGVDITLLWEEAMARFDKQGKIIFPYPENFLGSTSGGVQPVPGWWKNPSHRQRIAHLVHGCEEPARQRALSLANERNAGLVFVMDQRGGPAHDAYDHLPDYFATEVRELDSYLDFGFDPLRALRAAGRYATANHYLHAWPNFEAAWYGQVHVRGTFRIAAGTQGVSRQQVSPADLLGAPPLYDIPGVWAAAQAYARDLGKEAALPTFEEPGTGQGFCLVLFDQGLSWLHRETVLLSDTEAKPTFAEPGFVMRNINRVLSQRGFLAAFPTFDPDGTDPRGRLNQYACYAIDAGYGITWEDVPTTTYIAQL